MSSLVVVGMLLGLAGCRHSFPSDTPDALRLTNHRFGVQHAKRSERLALPFYLDRAGTNGTAIVLGYLKAAEQRGAKWVSDLAIAIQFRHNGVAMECVSKILVEDGSAAAAAPAAEAPASEPAATDEPEYDTTVRPWQPEQVDSTVTDRDLICHKEGKQVTWMGPKIENQFDVEVKGNVEKGRIGPVPKSAIVWQDSCELKPVQRQVRRYGHFLAAKFSPPDLLQIGSRYSDWRLSEAPPSCHPIQLAQGAAMQQRVEAELHYTGKLGISKLPTQYSR